MAPFPNQDLAKLQCHGCGSGTLQLAGKKRGRFIAQEFSFYECGDCGLISVEPFSGFEIYNDAYYRGEGPDPYVDYQSEYANWNNSDRLRELEDLGRIAERYFNGQTGTGSLRWLDFGCGAGALLKYLRHRGTLAGRPLEISGHDIGSYADLLRTADKFRILGLDELSSEPSQSYDVISMIEVVEHLPRPIDQLQLTSRLLRPGGLLLLTTGNLKSPMGRVLGINHPYCVPEIHVSLFSPGALRTLYRKVGLEPFGVRYHDAVRFKTLKTLRWSGWKRSMVAALLRVPAAVRLIDTLHGVSAMPCAIKPK